jgi:hypothetical protein
MPNVAVGDSSTVKIFYESGSCFTPRCVEISIAWLGKPFQRAEFNPRESIRMQELHAGTAH